MNRDALLDVLRETDFLSDMTPEDLQRIAAISNLCDYGAGHIIFREGGPAARVYIVIRGDVSLEVCAAGRGCQRILTVGPGELLAWSAILEHTRLTATARAITPTQLVQMSSSQLADICDQNPAFGYQFMRRTARALAVRLTATRLQLLDVYTSPVLASVSPME